jgi:hypothetical protein
MVFVTCLGRDGMLPRFLLEPTGDEVADPDPHEDDEEQPAHELGEGEFPAEKDPEDDPDLEDQVRRGELKDHRRGKACPFLEKGLRDRDGGVAARGGSGPEPGRQGKRAGPTPAKGVLEALARDPGLNDPGEHEPEDERPPHLPGHLECVPEALTDQLEGAHSA